MPPAQGDGLQVGQALVGAVQQELGDARVPSQDLGVRVQDSQVVRVLPEPVCGVQVQCQGSAQLICEGVVRLEPEDPQLCSRTSLNPLRASSGAVFKFLFSVKASKSVILLLLMFTRILVML